MNELGIDSLWRYSFHLDRFAGSSADTLASNPSYSPEDIFGRGSVLVAQSADLQGVGSWLTSPIYFHVVLLSMFVLFCLSLINYPTQIVALFKTLFRPLYCDKMIRECNHTFSSMLHRFTSMGVVMLALFFVRLGDHVGGRMEDIHPFGYWLMPLIVCIILAIGIYQRIVLRIAAYLTLNRPFINTLLYLNRVLFSLATLVLSPLCFLYFLNYSSGSEVVFWALAALISILSIVFIMKSYRLFMEQNFSILQWILYLCGVEFLPVSFAMLIIMRF